MAPPRLRLSGDHKPVSDPRVLVAGEALIDFLPLPLSEGTGYRPVPGGSPFNVAIGLARLGVPTGFVGRLSLDPFGRLLRRHLESNGVDGRYALEGEGPSTLAFITEGPGSEPEYTFFTAGAADRELHPKDLPADLPTDAKALHFGSYSIACEPIGSTLLGWAEQEHEERLIAFDPNLRPALIGDPDRYRNRLARWLQVARIVKASCADVEILYPGDSIEAVAARWLAQGARLVVITRGADGVSGFLVEGRFDLPGEPVDVVDTVGAGDAFMAGLLAGLDRHGLLSLEAQAAWSPQALHPVLAYAQRVAATTCTRPGADPPDRQTVENSSRPPH